VLEVGDYVRILSGKFPDFCGELRSVDIGTQVAFISVTLFCRETAVEVLLDKIEAAERPVTTPAGRPRDPTDILDEED
jgi:transcription antitermination factor NusG